MLLWFREQFIHENAIDIMLYPCQLNMALNMFDGFFKYWKEIGFTVFTCVLETGAQVKLIRI